MQIARNTVVSFDYTLTDDDGEIIDSSQDHEPLTYLHGVGEIIPGLEEELDGKLAGDQLQVVIAPEKGYGERNEALLQDVSRDQFEEIEDLEIGMQFHVDAEDEDEPLVITIVEIADDVVTVDGNHPLAGLNLNFEVTVREVRPATEDELEHGHAHGPGGHSH